MLVSIINKFLILFEVRSRASFFIDFRVLVVYNISANYLKERQKVMKYIRTKDEVYEVHSEYLNGLILYLDYKNPQYDETLKKNFYLRKYVYQEGMLLESVTFEEWIKHIESL